MSNSIFSQASAAAVTVAEPTEQKATSEAEASRIWDEYWFEYIEKTLYTTPEQLIKDSQK